MQLLGHAIALMPNFFLKRFQVFSDDNHHLDRNDSHSSTSVLDSPLCRPLHASSAARQVPVRPLDDDEDGEEGGRNILVRSFQSDGKPRCGHAAAAASVSSAMPRVGSAPPEIGVRFAAHVILLSPSCSRLVMGSPQSPTLDRGLLSFASHTTAPVSLGRM